jgi:hypothetical protein
MMISKEEMKYGDLFMNQISLCMWIGKHKNVSAKIADHGADTWFMTLTPSTNSDEGSLMYDPIEVHRLGINLFDVMQSAYKKHKVLNAGRW